ncbi:MAG: hypothetical protein ACREQB_09560 [Candidatus Binataceae bacterium]
MGGILTSIMQMGIVRVLSVPIAIALLVWLMWMLASPPPSNDNDDAEIHQS